jgi:hypothetical protein
LAPKTQVPAVDSQSQHVMKITLDLPETKTLTDIKTASYYTSSNKKQSLISSSKSAQDPRRSSLQKREPAVKPTLKLQMPKHTAKNEPVLQQARDLTEPVELKSDTESLKSVTVNVGFCPGKLTGQQQKKNQRGTVLFGLSDANQVSKRK